MDTLTQLKNSYPANYLHINTLLKDHFTHINSEEYFIRQVREGKIAIKLSRLNNTKKSPHIVWLTDLAQFLDEQQRSQQ